MILESWSAIANHLWQSTVFAAIAGLLTLAFRKNRAAVRYGLWLAASVKFLIPFVVLVSLGGQFGWRTAPMQSSVPLVMEQIGQPFTGPVTPPLLAAVPEAPSRVPAVLFAIWLSGFAVSGIVWGRKWWLIRRAVRTGVALELGLPIRVMSSPTKLEPGVFGIFKPVLLLPEGIAERLTPAQLQAIVAHELCHVRRRDNLAAALHMVVEAVFWFHPLVWWIGTRMVAERERACDEAVLAEMGDPGAYASGILNVCKFYLESPLVCVAGVTGSNLKRRIEAIMTGGKARRISVAKKLMLGAAGLMAMALPLVFGVVNASQIRAQSQPVVRPAFEVASIRVNDSMPNESGRITPSPDGLTVVNYPLKGLVSFAYGFRDDLVSAPEWLGSARYNISTKAADRTPLDTMKLMLQRLLEERFGLVVHREMRDLPVYALIVAKGGPKHLGKGSDGPRGMEPVDSGHGPALHWKCKNVSMAGFAGFLSRPGLERSVIDLTGLTGGFDFTFDIPPQAADLSFADYWLSVVFPSVQDQLGIKVEARKAPLEVLVVDHAERVPTEN